MTLHLWESQLLLLAHEPLVAYAPQAQIHADRATLQNAYRICEDITRENSKTFYIASGLLPREKRLGARALYAFCRLTDDLIDEAEHSSERRDALEHWQKAVTLPNAAMQHPVALAWADTRARFNIPQGYAQQLIDGVARDLNQNRYETFDDLAAYAYGVASTVGLMAMHIIGYAGESALPYAVKLGVALQVTNILRDIDEDLQNGRLYLPLDELAQFGLSEADIAARRVDDRWRAFMRFQIERNRQLYADSRPGIALLNPEGRFAITAAADLYQAILDDIEAHDYNVFGRRAHIGLWGKLRRLPGIWQYSQNVVV
jgi:15-cis-phytoene synthase